MLHYYKGYVLYKLPFTPEISLIKIKVSGVIFNLKIWFLDSKFHVAKISNDRKRI